MAHDSIMKSFRLDGRRILVTGAGGYLGERIARGISEAGATVVLGGRSPDKVQRLAESLRETGASCESVAFDIANPSECRAVVLTLEKSVDRLDGIVNCAYGGRPATIETATQSDFDMAWAQSLNGPFELIRSAIPLLAKAASKTSGGASIVNIASMYGHVSPDPRIYGGSGQNSPPFYGAAKAGLLQLTRYLAVHLGPQGIRVNSISPGPFPAPSVVHDAPHLFRALCEKTPLGRIGSANELIGPTVFLLFGGAFYVTGADLGVDGGWTAW